MIFSSFINGRYNVNEDPRLVDLKSDSGIFYAVNFVGFLFSPLFLAPVVPSICENLNFFLTWYLIN